MAKPYKREILNIKSANQADVETLLSASAVDGKKAALDRLMSAAYAAGWKALQELPRMRRGISDSR